MSHLFQLSISEVEFLHLDQYFILTLSPWKLLEMLWEVFEFYSYLPVWTLLLCPFVPAITVSNSLAITLSHNCIDCQAITVSCGIYCIQLMS